MALTNTQIEALKPRKRGYKKFDGGGLLIFITPAGNKVWRFTYRMGGKPKMLSFGAYDRKTNGLTEARAKLAAAKLTLKAGRDPAITAPAMDGQATFETLGRAWHARNEGEWTPKHAAQILRRLEVYVFPILGPLAVSSITRNDILACLKPVEDRGIIETVHRLKHYIGQILRFSDDDGVVDSTASLKGRLKSRPRVKPYRSLKAQELGPFLVALDESHCERETRLAILLTILTAARTGEIIGARWDEFEDLKYAADAMWRVPSERMKMDREHLIPLSRQAQAVLKELHKQTGNSKYLFPGRGGEGHMSNNTMLFHCYAMGYRNKTTMHGFRSSFSTFANESGLWHPDVIELALAHDDDDKIRAAYNSAQHLPKRRELLQWWADQLDAARRRTRQERRIQV